MRIVRQYTDGDFCTTGGSISRLQEEVYREAADLAYYFKWQRGDIFGMTMQERRLWLSQIKRINFEQKMARDKELTEHTEYVRDMRTKETG